MYDILLVISYADSKLTFGLPPVKYFCFYQQETLGEEPYVLMLVGTQVDKDEREVQEEEGRDLSEVLVLFIVANHSQYSETSRNGLPDIWTASI